MRLIAAGLGAIIVVSAGLIVFHLRRSVPSPAPEQQQSSTDASTGMQDESSSTVPRGSGSGTSGSSEATPGNFDNTSGGSSQAFPSSSINQQQTPLISQQSTRPPIDTPTGSDEYPGAQAIDVDKSKMPDVGFPVATEAYTTSDSVETVIEYYKRRYPGAQVSQMQGQNIIAIERNGSAKVIAIGSNGSETRIAIVKPQ